MSSQHSPHTDVEKEDGKVNTHTTDMCDLSKSVTERDRANTIGGEGMRITCGFDLLSIVISPRFFA